MARSCYKRRRSRYEAARGSNAHSLSGSANTVDGPRYRNASGIWVLRSIPLVATSLLQPHLRDPDHYSDRLLESVGSKQFIAFSHSPQEISCRKSQLAPFLQAAALVTVERSLDVEEIIPVADLSIVLDSLG